MKLLRDLAVFPAVAALLLFAVPLAGAMPADPGACLVGAAAWSPQTPAGMSYGRADTAGGSYRLAEGPSGRGCAENCVAQCRAAQSSCSGDAASCRAQFQICARRCVVSCGSR